MARAHRIGQRSKVTIFRLVTRATYEQEMFLRSSKKLGLDHALLTNLEVGKGQLVAADAHDINKLLRLGAYGVFDDDDTAAKTFMEENIESMLAKRSTTITVNQQAPNEDDEEGEEGGSKPAASASAAAGQSSQILSRLNFNKMKFESSGASSQIDVNDPHFWNKLAPTSDAERFSPDQLLSQLTDNSATESAASRSEFWKYLAASTERILKLRREGEEVSSIDDLMSLLIQFCATSSFPESQRNKARAWLEEAERRVERKVRSKTFPAAAVAGAGGRRAARQRGAFADTDKDKYVDEKPRRGRKSAGATKFGRIVNVSESSEEGGDTGSDFGGDSDDSAASEEEDEEAAPSGRGGRQTGERRHNKLRVARAQKRRKGLLNLDICEICHQSGKLLSCDGPCQGWYHLACAGLVEPPPADQEWTCKRCVEKRHPCHACHVEGIACEPGSEVEGGVNKCSIATCGRYYHIQCAKRYPITFWYENSLRFRCALHYCASCAVPGDSQSMIHCQTCPIGLHIRCITGQEIRLAKKSMYCAACVGKVAHTPHGMAAVAGAEQGTWVEPYREKKRPPPSKHKKKRRKTKRTKQEKAEAAAAEMHTRRGDAAAASGRSRASASPAPSERQFHPGQYGLRFRLDNDIVWRMSGSMRFFDEYVAPRSKRASRNQHADEDSDGSPTEDEEDEDGEEDEEDDDMPALQPTKASAKRKATALPAGTTTIDKFLVKPEEAAQSLEGSPTQRSSVGGKEPRAHASPVAAASPPPDSADSSAASAAPRPRSILEMRAQQQVRGPKSSASKPGVKIKLNAQVAKSAAAPKDSAAYAYAPITNEYAPPPAEQAHLVQAQAHALAQAQVAAGAVAVGQAEPAGLVPIESRKRARESDAQAAPMDQQQLLALQQQQLLQQQQQQQAAAAAAAGYPGGVADPQQLLSLMQQQAAEEQTSKRQRL